jgi:anti-sigma regulatory factor (Ser/Thr protein kinase)
MKEIHESARGTALVYLNSTPTAPGDARRFVVGVLDDHPAVESAKLVISELVTNAIRHGGGDAGCITVSVDQHAGPSGDHVRIEVSQPNHVGFDFEERDAGHMDPTGRGLMIVDAVAEDWGFDRSNGSVWVLLA